MLRKILLFILVALAVVGPAQVKKIKFWVAPNPNQEMFWKSVIERWNAERPDIQIEWSVVPAAASSEEAILTAIAAGTAPDISENIFGGFAAQLVELDQLVAFDQEFGDEFWKPIDARKMRNIIQA